MRVGGSPDAKHVQIAVSAFGDAYLVCSNGELDRYYAFDEAEVLDVYDKVPARP